MNTSSLLLLLSVSSIHICILSVSFHLQLGIIVTNLVLPSEIFKNIVDDRGRSIRRSKYETVFFAVLALTHLSTA